MVRTKPFITVITPTYNCEQFLWQAIDSIISQDQTIPFDWEMLICDDGSTDNTKELVEKYIQKYPNNIFYYYQENSWIPWCARNLWLDHMNKNSDFTVLIDSDDWLKSDCFYKCLKVFLWNNWDKYFSVLFLCETQFWKKIWDLSIFWNKKSINIDYKRTLKWDIDFELCSMIRSNLYLSQDFRYETDIITESVLHFKIRKFCDTQNQKWLLLNYIWRVYRIWEWVQITKTISPIRFKRNAIWNERILDIIQPDLIKYWFKKSESEYLFRAGINRIMYWERKKWLSLLRQSLKTYFQIKVFILYLISLILWKNLIIFLYKLYI